MPTMWQSILTLIANPNFSIVRINLSYWRHFLPLAFAPYVTQKKFPLSSEQNNAYFTLDACSSPLDMSLQMICRLLQLQQCGEMWK
jgi:hypothetical protein